jgi:anti-sigma factor RsiW
MAHDNYLSLISLSLDNLLAEDEQSTLEEHLQSCAACALAWDRMMQLDRMLTLEPEAAPPIDFKSRVMVKVSNYEKQRHLYPWMTLILSVVLLAAMMSIMLPVLFVSLGLYRVLFEVPVVGAWLTQLLDVQAQIVAFVGASGASIAHWLSFVTTDPTSLAVIVTVLVMVSIWVGMREVLKLTPAAEVSAQGA